MMPFFVDVLVPIPVERTFVYAITEAESACLNPGMRVAVPFGKSKIYTGLVLSMHQNPPSLYKARPIYEIIDEKPIVTPVQLQFWQWISKYYMCTLGEVFKAALPSALILENRTVISLKRTDHNETKTAELGKEEQQVLEILRTAKNVTITGVIGVIGHKKAMSALHSLIEKNIVVTYEELVETYKPKQVSYIRLNPQYKEDEPLQQLLLSLSQAPTTSRAVLAFIAMEMKTPKVTKSAFAKAYEFSTTFIKTLVKKHIFEEYSLQTDRVSFDANKTSELKTLSPAQQNVFEALCDSPKAVVLLKGVTSSGKTEVYAKYIQTILDSGKQVLYMLPEIGLATQQLMRLSSYFGGNCSVYHSKYSDNERVEVWNNVLNDSPKAKLVIGTRSSLFLPFSKLGAIIIDEEHEATLKQVEPSPRYNARDSAVVLAKYYGATVLLGSATPSLESYYNALTGKYALLELNERYKGALPPEIELIDLKTANKKKEMKGIFSKALLDSIAQTVAKGEQIILFHNRRGFASLSECLTCGFIPRCEQCDVSLTYHKYNNSLRCHYCGYTIPMQNTCAVCGTSNVDVKGFGTEQVELQLKEYLPSLKMARMDLETTRGKHSYEKIVKSFEQQEVDVLIGTQMVTKGLDFSNVSLIGIISADKILNFPDFRAHERAFQLMHQAAGRSGRSEKRGLVMVQTYNVAYPIFRFLETSDYTAMYQNEILQREQFKYPPFYRLIKISLKHKNYATVEDSSLWLSKALKNMNVGIVLGPESPSVSRIKNEYIKVILLKLSADKSHDKLKRDLAKLKVSFMSISQFRSVRLILDVDCQ